MGEHHGRLDIRVRNKIFATLPPDGTVVLKITPENLETLTKLEPGTFGRVWGDRWVGVDPNQLSTKDVRELLFDAWKLAAPKRLIREFEESGGPLD